MEVILLLVVVECILAKDFDYDFEGETPFGAMNVQALEVVQIRRYL
jgi:hypothetical protein